MTEIKKPLSNVQLELMKIYSTNISDTELLELKGVLASFFAEKSTKEADKLWSEKDMSQELMDKWLNEKS